MGRRVFTPATVKRFRRTEPLYFYTELYNSGHCGLHSAGNPLIPAGTRLELDQLPPGAYRLELTAAAVSGRWDSISSNDSARQLLAASHAFTRYKN
jgi:hypothetical protein